MRWRLLVVVILASTVFKFLTLAMKMDKCVYTVGVTGEHQCGKISVLGVVNEGYRVVENHPGRLVPSAPPVQHIK